MLLINKPCLSITVSYPSVLHIVFAALLDKIIPVSLANIINFTESLKDGFCVEYHLQTSRKNVIDIVVYLKFNNKLLGIGRACN